jgi:hypothetical protein
MEATWQKDERLLKEDMKEKNIPECQTVQFVVLIHIYLRSIRIFYSHLRTGFPIDLFSVDLPVKILKALPPPSTVATHLAHLYLLDLITLTLLGKQC